MPITQHNPNKSNTAIEIDANPARLLVHPVPYPGGNTVGATIDLTPFQGGPFRLYLDSDGSLSTDLYRDHYWLLAEATLPNRRYDNEPTGQVDEHGQAIMTMVERQLDLNDIDVTVFPFPEVV